MKVTFLKIFTSRTQEQKRFYEDVLDLKVLDQGSSFSIQIGFTEIEFVEDAKARPYHLAFHIPGGTEKEALEWLKSRTGILKNQGDEITNFPAWNARSVYFYDAGQNILEFISRRDFLVQEKQGFSQERILGVSEIGLATDAVKEKFEFLSAKLGLEKYSGDTRRFCATGDDEGLFIVIDKNRKDWIPTGDKAFASAFEVRLSTDTGIFDLAFKNDRLLLL